MAHDRPWLAAYPEGVPADIAEPGQPLTAHLDGAVARFPARIEQQAPGEHGVTAARWSRR